MGLLHDIQESVVRDETDLGAVLLKLQLLASRLGSDYLEEWVKHEAEGYPKGVEVPEYRMVPVAYTATFSGPFGAGIKNAPVPIHLVEKFAGENWVKIEIRESIAGVDALVDSAKGGGTLGIDASNLILLLQGNIYEGYACNAVDGRISSTSLREIQQALKSRILQFTIQLERAIPAAADIQFGRQESIASSAETVQRITQNTFYGTVNAVSGGAGSSFKLAISVGDQGSFVRELEAHGIPRGDAQELADILSQETPLSDIEPLGSGAQQWLAEKLKNTVSGVWNVGLTVATNVITEAAMKFYGLK